MKIKRIRKLRVNSHVFEVRWKSAEVGAYFNYHTKVLEFGTKNCGRSELLMLLCHELQEIVTIEMGVRLQRPDCRSDFIFVYDHRQHDTMMHMFSGLLEQFLK